MLPLIPLKNQSYRPLSHAFCLLHKNRFIYLLTDIGREYHRYGISDACRMHQCILTGNVVSTQARCATACRIPAAILPPVLPPCLRKEARQRRRKKRLRFLCAEARRVAEESLCSAFLRKPCLGRPSATRTAKGRPRQCSSLSYQSLHF